MAGRRSREILPLRSLDDHRPPDVNVSLRPLWSFHSSSLTFSDSFTPITASLLFIPSLHRVSFRPSVRPSIVPPSLLSSLRPSSPHLPLAPIRSLPPSLPPCFPYQLQYTEQRPAVHKPVITPTTPDKWINRCHQLSIFNGTPITDDTSFSRHRIAVSISST